MSAGLSHAQAQEIAYSLGAIGEVGVKRFFGGWGLVLEGHQLGFLMKGVLYLRVCDLSRPRLAELGCKPFSYAARGKTVIVETYYEAPSNSPDDPSVLCALAREAHAAALSAVSTHAAVTRRGNVRVKKEPKHAAN